MKSFDEAINIRCADIDITTGERISHSEKYTRAINLLGGLDAVIPLIPFSRTQIQAALANHDEHLNTLPLKTWDFKVPFVKTLCYRKAGINCMSLSQGVCLLKEAARQWAEREEN
jgi:hypothetical protein